MSWTWEEIEADWLAGGEMAVSPAHAVEAFNCVDQALGHDWVLSSRISSGATWRGLAPTLHVVATGQVIGSLRGIAGVERLLELMRQNDSSAFAEATAIYLLRSSNPEADIELFPEVRVGERVRKPDFRIRRQGEEWTYAEVTQPDVSEEQEQVNAVLERLTGIVHGIKKSFSLEVFLRRKPSAEEVEVLANKIPQFCSQEGPVTEALSNELGLLLLNYTQPGEVVLVSHQGEADSPKLTISTAVWGPGEPHRHIVVRLAFADARAEEFLRKEAKQLPKETPGLIMIQMAHAPGGFRCWVPLLQRRLQPNLHTRVSAICLFASGLETTPDGEAWVPRVKVLANPHARLSLPAWIGRALGVFSPATSNRGS